MRCGRILAKSSLSMSLTLLGSSKCAPRRALTTVTASFGAISREVTQQPRDRDRLPRRGAVSLANKHPKRFWNMR